MAIQRDIYVLDWVIPERVLLLRYTKPEPLTSDVLTQIGADLTTLIEDGVAPIHLITDSNLQGDVKVNIAAMREAFTVFEDKRWGWVMLVGLNRVSNFFANVMCNIFRIKFETPKSVEAAIKRLHKLDESLAGN